MEGLENCKLLEEINFEKNKISHIYGLENLIYLKKIELGKNKIVELRGISNLKTDLYFIKQNKKVN